MAEQKFLTPLRVGLLVAVIAYFIFTFHAMFTLSWIGEWEPVQNQFFSFVLLVEDISATIGLVFRFAASIIAIAAVVYYFAKKSMTKSTAQKLLRVIVVFEGIYWLGLIATAGFNVYIFGRGLFLNFETFQALSSLLLSVIPTVLEAIVLPVALFILAFKLSPTKPLSGAIKWSLISTTILATIFWLIYTSIWVAVIQTKGIEYLWTTVEFGVVESHPEHLVSFITTAFGLAALAIYSAYVTKKSAHIENLDNLKTGAIGVITLSFGAYFLWNYVSWVVFAGDTWNDWYAWFLGHNLDLWMLALPLAALPLFFYRRNKTSIAEV